jgi:hypothetical protein
VGHLCFVGHYMALLMTVPYGAKRNPYWRRIHSKKLKKRNEVIKLKWRRSKRVERVRKRRNYDPTEIRMCDLLNTSLELMLPLHQTRYEPVISWTHIYWDGYHYTNGDMNQWTPEHISTDMGTTTPTRAVSDWYHRSFCNGLRLYG